MSKDDTLLRWFDTIRGNKDDLKLLIVTVESACEYYLQEADSAREHLTVRGELSTMLASQPGLLSYYKTIANDAMSSRKWLEIAYEVETTDRFKWFMTDPDAKAEYGKITVTEAKRYAEGEDVSEAMNELIRVLANSQHALESIVDGFNQRGITLSKITDIKVSGNDEIWISPNG